MLFQPQGPGFNPQPGSGDLQQGNKNRGLVRKRTTGPRANRNGRLIRWQNCRAYLTACAEYWEATLTPAQRTTWDTDPLNNQANGFDFFIYRNKQGQGLAFTQPLITPWNRIPPYVTPPDNALVGVGLSEFTGPNLYSPSSVKLRYVNAGLTPNCAVTVALAPDVGLKPNGQPKNLYRWEVAPLPVAPGGAYVEVAAAYIAALGTLVAGKPYYCAAFITTTDGLHVADYPNAKLFKFRP